jgi:hypothetical protein
VGDGGGLVRRLPALRRRSNRRGPIVHRPKAVEIYRHPLRVRHPSPCTILQHVGLNRYQERQCDYVRS